MSTKHLLELLKLRPRYLVAISATTGTVLLIPKNTAKVLHVDKLTENYGHWVVLVFIASCVLLATTVAINVTPWILQTLRFIVVAHYIRKNLESLSEDEKRILRFYETAERPETNFLADNDRVVRGLVAKGIIHWDKSPRGGPGISGYKVSQIARHYIDVKAGLLHGDTNGYRTDENVFCR